MDSRDLFRQLTCGVNFAATKTTGGGGNRKRARSPPQPVVRVKLEKLEPDDSAHSDSADSSSSSAADVPPPKPPKREPDDAAGQLQLYGSIVATNLTAKRPKQPATAAQLAQLAAERHNELRNRHQLHVTGGRSVPPPLDTFAAMEEELQLPAQLMANLAECGYRQPTAIQMQAIPVMCAQRSLLACAPTGSGKTAAFLVPIVRQLGQPGGGGGGGGGGGARALVLCPTRELAKQTQRECLRLVEGIGLRVHTLSKANVAAKRGGAGGKCDVLVTTPNRVCHLLAAAALDLSGIRWLVLDEADKLFESAGSSQPNTSFLDQFTAIAAACRQPPEQPQCRIALFSATRTTAVGRWLRHHCKGACTVTVGQRNSATADVHQRLQFCGSEAGKLLAFRELLRTGLRPPVLVFVETRDRAEQLYAELIYDGCNVERIHAERSQLERDEVVRRFREGGVWVLICTELVGRGLDFKGVNLVVNYDFPPTPLAYIHRVGRTGRAGRRGEAVTYFTHEDRVQLKAIARIAASAGGEVPAYMLAMKERGKRAQRRAQKERRPREAIRVERGGAKRKLKGGKVLEGKKKKAVVKVATLATKTKKPAQPRREKAKRKRKAAASSGSKA